MNNEKINIVKLPEFFNHRPEQIGIWFPYNGYRYKDVYHIKLKDGLVLHHMRPNGTGWYPALFSRPIEDPIVNARRSLDVHDSDVIEVMLSPEDDNYPYRGNRSGELRTQYQYALFGILVNKDGSEIVLNRKDLNNMDLSGKYINFDDL